MKWKIIAIGKPALAFARDGAEEYLNRLKHYTQAELVFAKDAARQQQAAAGADLRIALDERGQNLSTQELVGKIDPGSWVGRSRRSRVLIGASDGQATSSVLPRESSGPSARSHCSTNSHSSSCSNRSTAPIPSNAGSPTTGNEIRAAACTCRARALAAANQRPIRPGRKTGRHGCPTGPPALPENPQPSPLG